jgi:hypothetical protein
MLPTLQAQDQAQSETPLQFGDFGVQGSASAGYRFTTVKGYEPMFQELFDLNQGPRIMDFNLFGTSKASPFADQFSLTMSGLGGDPYPGAQLTLSKSKVYDLRVNWRQSYFYWNQNDGVLLPPLNEPGMTNNHDWATVRKVGSVDLTLHATNNLRFHFQYYRTSFTGATFTTFVPDFFGSPGRPDPYAVYVGSNPYDLYSPTFDNTNRFTGGFDYTWHEWNFHYDIGYQTYNGTMNFNNIASPEYSFNTATTSTHTTPLTSASWTQYQRLTTPISEFSYTGKPESWLDVHGGYTFYRYSGPATFDQSLSGNDTGKTTGAYNVSESARATVSEPNDIVNQGFTFHIKPWWDADLNWRYDRFTTDAVGNFQSVFNQNGKATAKSGDTTMVWRDGLNQLDFAMDFTPVANLIVRPGVTLLQSNIEKIEDGEADPANTLRINTVNPTLGVFYRPTKRLDLRGEFYTFDSGASFTAISPHTDVTGRIVATLRLNSKLSLSDEMYMVNQRLLATDFHGKVHSNSTMLNFALNAKYSLFGGFTYDDEFASGDIIYARGTPASGAHDLLRDQALNRVIQGGFEAKPVKYFGIRFTGNFDRTTGVGEINGEVPEAPAYGPLTWPLATGTVYFDIPRAGRLSLDLQRSYYIQQIFAGNNFSANLLTVRWTRNF